MKKKLKVLVLFDGTSPTTVDQDFSKELQTKDWKTEADVMAALGALGYSAEHLAIFDDVDLLRQKLETCAPDVLFNLVEQFRNNPGFDQNIVSFFEMQGLPFTGCGSTGLTLCKHKGISKKVLHYHGIHVPNFVVVPRGQRIGRPRQLKFPILVKPVKEKRPTEFRGRRSSRPTTSSGSGSVLFTRNTTATQSPRNTSRAANSTSA